MLAEEVASRDTHGGENRVEAARFPQIRTVDDLDFLRESKNIIFLGPPGTGETHLSIALDVQAARRGYRVAFANAKWFMRLGEAKRAGRLADELEHVGRIPLLIVDEVGYIPFRHRKRHRDV